MKTMIGHPKRSGIYVNRSTLLKPPSGEGDAADTLTTNSGQAKAEFFEQVDDCGDGHNDGDDDEEEEGADWGDDSNDDSDDASISSNQRIQAQINTLTIQRDFPVEQNNVNKSNAATTKAQNTKLLHEQQLDLDQKFALGTKISELENEMLTIQADVEAQATHVLFDLMNFRFQGALRRQIVEACRSDGLRGAKEFIENDYEALMVQVEKSEQEIGELSREKEKLRWGLEQMEAGARMNDIYHQILGMEEDAEENAGLVERTWGLEGEVEKLMHRIAIGDLD